MSYAARSKDNPGDVGRAADQQQSVDNDVFLKAAVEGGTIGNVVRRVIEVDGIVDNVVTEIYQIITTNETGAHDAGVYAVWMNGVVSHITTVDPEDSAETACKGFAAQFCRAMENGGTGAASAVTENTETASAASAGAQRDVGAVTLTLVEVDEYTLSVRIQIDLTGAAVGAAAVAFIVELSWFGFTTSPEISPV